MRLAIRTSSRRHPAILDAIVAATVVATVLTGLDASITALRAGTAPPAEQVVNRANKGDRLPIRPLRLNTNPETAPLPAPSDRALTDGCEPLVSPLANAALSRIAGRCVS